MTKIDIIELGELSRAIRQGLAREIDELKDKMMQKQQFQQLLDQTSDVISQNQALGAEVEELQKQQADERKAHEELQQQLEAERKAHEELQQQLEEAQGRQKELQQQLLAESTLQQGLQKKIEEQRDGDSQKKEIVLKILSTYVSRSKRKTQSTRAYAKTAAMDIARIAKIVLPPELEEAIQALDDEQVMPSVVNVAGNYNDVHSNGDVKFLNR